VSAACFFEQKLPEKVKKRKAVITHLPKQLSKNSIEDLKQLFESVAPDELRDNLLEIYHTYMIYVHDTLPGDFKKMSMNLYLLIQTLGSLEMEEKAQR
jgi:hypothetical protein